MAKKVVNPDFNISGMSMFKMYKQFRLYLRMPYIAMAEGPGFDCIFQLFRMHTIGRFWVYLEINYPTIHSWIMRINKSLAFRFNHYKKIVRSKRIKKPN